MATTEEAPASLTIDAKPYGFTFPLRHTALLIIDMQRDFLMPKGFGEIQGGNLSAVQASITPTKKLLDAYRSASLPVFHTREGHVPDLSDCPSSKLERQKAAPGNTQHKKVIGEKGELGRLLTRGEHGHDIIDELKPRPGEVVIDKPGKGSFWNTALLHKLKAHAVTHLIVAGVTTECCFATTIREANDRGFECCGIEEATSGYNDNCFKDATLEMLHWSQGLFGFVAKLQPLLDALATLTGQNATPAAWDGDLTISALQKAYKNGLSPVTVAEAVYKKVEDYKPIDSAVWIHLEKKDAIIFAAKSLEAKYPDRNALPPLFGIPFSIKDSYDIAGLPTTTACPPLAQIASESAPVYTQITSQGGLFIGKTNLDQLATGLVGCRSPYGTPHSVFHADFVSGGSSSGGCVSVGAKLVSFSLTTDTAGSGRVPAMFNGIVGYKPTRGLVSATGITPACERLDCVSIAAGNVEDARKVWQIAEGHDELDPYSKPEIAFERHVNSIGAQAKTFKFGVPPKAVVEVCDPIYQRLFGHAVKRLEGIGGILTPVDWTPFDKAGRLLYDGSFVCERLTINPDDFLEKNRNELHPVIVQLMESVLSRTTRPVDVYRDLQSQVRYTAQASKILTPSATGVDILLVPTAPTHWSIEQVLDDPIKKNSHLGEFTHFANVLDLCCVSVPAGTYDLKEKNEYEVEEGKLPFGITLVGGSRMDAETLEIARRFEEAVCAT